MVFTGCSGVRYAAACVVALVLQLEPIAIAGQHDIALMERLSVLR